MIVKKVAAKKATKSSYKALANYILDLRNNMEKVETYYFSNCSYTEIAHNILEIENTQSLNQRVKQDKTYHLIVSFQEDENPSDEIIQDIEKELLQSIGLEDCQRLSVIHSNTNYKHMHIAVNLIDPITHKIKNLPFDKLTLQRKAGELEIKHNLKITNHVRKTLEEKKNDMDDKTIHTGIVNFKDWVKENAAAEIKKVLADDKTTWKDLYKTLAKYDLELKDRGNGNVISSRSRKLFIKASDISRELSKAKLDKRYGEKDKEALKTIIDKIEPIHKFELKTNLKSNLWDEYREFEKIKLQEKEILLVKEKQQRELYKLNVKKKWQIHREKTMKDRTISRQEKQKIYKMINESRKKELSTYQVQFKEQRLEIYSKYKKLSYKDYLINKSLTGNKMALESLRRTKPEIKPKENTFAAISGKMNNQIFSFGDKLINKDGSITYRLNDESKVIDKGNYLKININNNKSNEVLNVLKIAIAKYGKDLDITGTEDFKREVIKTVQKYNLDVKFKDEKMQVIKNIYNKKNENSYSY
ncbi:hypothetical protein LPB137_00545 [Poseidonibacter parvus]|uniref:Uncharacterized protein n=1 Tax=Poseidonibacter parvus TaxID=1850254 RepID=A0A1P8KIR8_9BACT|nr:TraI/MobA(P) family conjugative relaxase [Poseidonibacter parvus]APW64424.1 hypothetical protein LPB137_00545 [Poseidonibacter parvus]